MSNKPSVGGTLRFNLRSDKLQKTGKAPIELIYQVQGQRKYFNTGLKCYPQNWNSDQQQAIYLDRKTAKKLMLARDCDLLPSEKDTVDFNSDLAALKTKIDDIETRFRLDKIIYSAEMVMNELKTGIKPTTKKEVPSKVLFDFMDKYIQDHTTTREPGSLTVYRSVKNHLMNYEEKTGAKVTFQNIDYAFFQSFQNYLIETAGLNNTTIAKQLSTVKTFLNYARAHGYEVSDKYKNFKIKKEKLEVIALTNEEFETLFYKDLSFNKRLAQVRDIFCLACSTALRYSDLAQLRWEHIKKDEIKLVVKKTKDPLNIPLNPYSKAILAKYKGMLRPLPMISNQKLNDYIKELCELAEIKEPVEIVRFRGKHREAIVYPKYQLIGVHTGRKTFCTLSLEKGMSAEEVMSISNHLDYKSFSRYVKITEQRKKVVMDKAWGTKSIQTKLKAV